MSTIEIIAGAVLLFASLLIVLIVSLQNNKGDGISSVIMGGSDSGSRDRGRDNDAKLARITKILAVVFFIVTLGVNIVSLIGK